MFQGAGDRPIFVGNFQDGRESPCYFHVENEINENQSLPYKGFRVPNSPFSPKRFRMGEFIHKTNGRNVHENPGYSRSDSHVLWHRNESQNSFREVETYSTCDSDLSFVTVDKYSQAESPIRNRGIQNNHDGSFHSNFPPEIPQTEHNTMYGFNPSEYRHMSIHLNGHNTRRHNSESHFYPAENLCTNALHTTRYGIAKTNAERNGNDFSENRVNDCGSSHAAYMPIIRTPPRPNLDSNGICIPNRHTNRINQSYMPERKNLGNYFPSQTTVPDRRRYANMNGHRNMQFSEFDRPSKYVHREHREPSHANYGLPEHINFDRETRDRKHKTPDSYDGKGVEWTDYICHFEQVSRWNRWSESDMAAQLAMSLRGNAQRILSELTTAELSNYRFLKHSLSQRFCPPEREIAHRCEFRNRKRQSNETVADFGYALRRLSSLAYPHLPVDARESVLIEQYIAGLGIKICADTCNFHIRRRWIGQFL